MAIDRHITFNGFDDDVDWLYQHFVTADNIQVTEHTDLDSLRDCITDTAPTATMFEIYSHSTEYNCGFVTYGSIESLADAFRSLPAGCEICFTGCNTGVCVNPPPIAKKAADAIGRSVAGVLGYATGYRCRENLKSLEKDPDKPSDSKKPCAQDLGLPDCEPFFEAADPQVVDSRFFAEVVGPHAIGISSSEAVAENVIPAPTFTPTVLKNVIDLMVQEGVLLFPAFTGPVGAQAIAQFVQKVNHTIPNNAHQTGRLPTAGAEAIFVDSMGIEYTLFSNLTGVDHFGKRWLLNLTVAEREVLRAVVKKLR